MKATTRLIDLILPEFFVFLEDQERLKNMQKGLDNKDNTNPNLTSLCLRKNTNMQGEQRRKYQDIFSSCLTQQNGIFSKPAGQCSSIHMNRTFACPVYPDTWTRKSHNSSEIPELLHNDSKIGVDIVLNPSIHCDAKDEKGDAS